MSNFTDNEIYRKIHFAVMAIESGARKLGISGKEMLTVLAGKSSCTIDLSSVMKSFIRKVSIG